jgi:hypothetical protein
LKSRSNARVTLNHLFCYNSDIISHGKVLSQGPLIWNIQVLVHTIKNHNQSYNFQYAGQGQTHGRVLSQGTLMWNIKVLIHTIQKIQPRLKFLVSKTPMSKSQRQICLFSCNGLVTRNTHVKCQSRSIYKSKTDIAKVNVFNK